MNYSNQFAIQRRNANADYLETPYVFDVRAPYSTIFADSTGNVGVSNNLPLAKLDVRGTISSSDAIQVGSSSLACGAGIPGAIRYQGTSLQFCNGTSWTTLGTSGGGQGDRIVSGTTNAIAWQDRSLTITTNNVQRMVVGEDGNVGIGTSTPNSLLDVAGPAGPSNSGPAVKISATTVNTNLSLFFRSPEARGSVNLGRSGLGQKGNALNIEATGDINFYPGGTNQGAESMVVDSTGNVGVGTISPTATLQVSGSFIVSTSAQVAARPTLYVGNDGRIGIGGYQNRQAMLTVGANTPLASPASALMVMEVSDSAISNGANSYVYPFELQHITGGGNTPRLLFSGYRRTAGSLWYGTGYRIQYAVDNSFATGDRAFVELGAGPNGDGQIILGVHNNDRLIITTNTLVASGTISVTNAIQVGTSSLTCSAGIPGAIRYNGGSLQFCDGSAWITLGSSAGVTGTGSATAVAYWNGSNALTYDSDGFYWDATNNRLGIGTNTPSVTLNVVANQLGAGAIRSMNLNSQGYAGITLGSHTNETVGMLTYSNAGAFAFPNSVWIGTRSNTVPLVFTANAVDVEDMRLSNGRLGIGTASATATLQVSGTFTVSLSTQTTTPSLFVTSRVGIQTSNPQEMAHIGNDGVGGRLFIGEDGAARRGLLIAATVANEVSGSTYPPFVRMTAFSYGGSKSLPLVINPHGSEGFVSIGKFDPKAMLDVQGTISASNAIQVGQSSLLCGSTISGSIRYNTTSDTLQVCTGSGWKSLVSGTTGGSGTLTGGGSATAIAFWSGASALSYDSGLYWDNVNKRLGVGTTAPLRRFEVAQASDDVLSGFGVANAALNSRVSLWVKGSTGHLWSGGTGQMPLVVNAGGGLVGIGTESPTVALQVSGSFVVSSTVTNLSPSLYVGADGRVGIGTANIPTAGNLFVVTPLYGGLGPAITVADNATVGRKNLKIGISTTAGVNGAGFIQYTHENSAHANIMLNPQGGNVAIGDIVARARLDVSGTISATDAIQLGQNTIACGVQVSGSIRYSVISNTVQFCNGTGWVSLASSTAGGGMGLADRITSGTHAVTVQQGSGFISITQSNTNTGWFDPTRGLVTLGVSATGPISGTDGYFSGSVGIGRLPDPEVQLAINRSDSPTLIQIRNIVGGSSQVLSIRTSSTANYVHFDIGGSGHTSSRFHFGDLASPDNAITTLGRVGVGTIAPSASLHVVGTVSITDAVQVGASGLMCSAGIPGALRYNSGNLQLCNGTAWSDLVSGGSTMGDRITSGSTIAIASENQSLTISTAGTPRVIVGTDGKVGIGTTTPTVGLDAYGHFVARTETGAPVIQTAGSGNGRVLLGSATVDDAQTTVQMRYAGNNITNGTVLSVQNSSSLQLFRVMHNGNVGVGVVSPTRPAAKLDVWGTISASDAIQVGTSTLSCSSGIPGAIRYNAGNLQFCDGNSWSTLSASGGDNLGNHTATQSLAMGNHNIVGSGRVSMTNVSTTSLDVYGDIRFSGVLTDLSDRRFKSDIERIPSALESMTKLEPVSFRMKGDSRTELGLIAQDVEMVFPQLVFTQGPNGMKSMNYIGLIAPIIRAVQELKSDNDNLRQSYRRTVMQLDEVKADLKAANDDVRRLQSEIGLMRADMKQVRQAIMK